MAGFESRTTYPNPADFLTPQQELLAFAQIVWGPQFDENGRARWGCFSALDGYSTGPYAGVTDGTDYYIVSETHVGVHMLLVSESGQVGGITGVVKSAQEAHADTVPRTIFWL